MSKPTLCLDFDGVIHSYTSGWSRADEVRDPPVPGALDFIIKAVGVFQVAIYSSRSHQPGGIHAMTSWLHSHMAEHLGGVLQANAVLKDIEWPVCKPSAKVTIDDRALTFTGVWPSLPALMAFEPWNAQERKRSA